MYRRSYEKFLTMFGVFAGSFTGNFFALYVFDEPVALRTAIIVSALFALVYGLICNKIGSEIDRSRFIKENEITPVHHYEYAPARKKMPHDEYKKLAFKEKIWLWINEKDEFELCEDGQKK